MISAWPDGAKEGISGKDENKTGANVGIAFCKIGTYQLTELDSLPDSIMVTIHNVLPHQKTTSSK